jgi:hypothetical protein
MTNPFNPDQWGGIGAGLGLLYFGNATISDLKYMRIGLDKKYIAKHKYRPMEASQMLGDLFLAALCGLALYEASQQSDTWNPPTFQGYRL